LLVNVENGQEVATSVFPFPSGQEGVLVDPDDPHLARQDPADYLAGLTQTVGQVLREARPEDVIGMGVDTTGSSPLPVNESGAPLAFQERFQGNPAALCWLWKDHTAHEEAAEITELAKRRGEPYLDKCGGTYSSEWFWSKVLHCARTSPEIFEAAYSWVECCDWVVGQIVGQADPKAMKRSVCAAGHKAMYARDWGGLPSREFLEELDPRLGALRDRLYGEAFPSDVAAGTVSRETSARTGLPEGIPVAVGAFDAHYGAVGSGVRPGVLVKILGTSTCDCLVHPLAEPLPDIPGICGIVPGSILPGHYGLEAGQSAVGDIFAWFARFCGRPQEDLAREAGALRPGQSGLLALDWNNGNRTVLVDPLLSGLLVGQTLHTTPAEVYRALVEATAFGALTIVRRFEEYGVTVERIVNCGGIAEKSPLVMQIYADVCNRPMSLSRSAQTCALGAAIFGAVVGGAYPTVEAAQLAMTGVKDLVYEPRSEAVAAYERLFPLYTDLHDAFGRPEWTGRLAHVMKELGSIREERY
jgi:L-ribulokinase